MVDKKRICFLLLAFFLILFLSNLGHAGFFDLFKGKTITGKATSHPTNVSISIVGANPVTIQVFNNTITGVTPTESSTTSVNFYITMTDPDGVNDLNDTSVSANFTRSGEALRQNSSCSLVNDIDSTSANYSCTIDMWYFDGSGQWNITVRGTDLGNLTFIQNTSTTFQYNQLQAIVISPNQFSFIANIGSANQTPTDDPTLINNTGNYNVSNVRVTGINLYGQSNSLYYINVGNFSADIDTGGSPPAECTGATALVNGTATAISGAILSPGNNSLGYANSTSGQEQIYYCLRAVASSLPSQVYSTASAGSWTVSIT